MGQGNLYPLENNINKHFLMQIRLKNKLFHLTSKLLIKNQKVFIIQKNTIKKNKLKFRKSQLKKIKIATINIQFITILIQNFYNKIKEKSKKIHN